MDELVARLSSGSQELIVDNAKSAKDLHDAVERGFVLLKFTGTRGGTCLGVNLDQGRTVVDQADFAAGTGTVQLVGTLVLNYNEVELSAQVDVATLRGQGRLALLADEAQWRAKRAQAGR